MFAVRKISKEVSRKKRSESHQQGAGHYPQEVRRVLRVREGDTLVFESGARGVYIRLRQPEDVFAEYEGAWRDGEGRSAEEINAWLRELRGYED